MTPTLFDIFSHTPSWVWGLLAALVVLGLLQARTHDVSPVRLWLQPTAIGVLSIWGVLHAFGAASGAIPVAGWALGYGLGFAANRALGLPRHARPNASGGFRVEGSLAPLALLAGVFAVRYTVGVALAIVPALAGASVFAFAASLAFGFPSGLLLARSLRIHATRLLVGDDLRAA